MDSPYGGLLPEESFPCWEIGALKESMLKNTFNTTECLNHVSPIVVEVPELSIMLLMSPPEGVLLEHLILFEVLSDTPSFIIGESETVFLEESIDSRNTSVP